MTRIEYLLCCISEECAEVSQRATKALRFGLGEIQPEQNLDNFERMMREFADLVAVIGMLQEEIGGKRFVRKSEIDEKRTKVLKFMDYSMYQCGTLKHS